MLGTSASRAWSELVEYARRDGATVYTVAERECNAIGYDASENAVTLVSMASDATGEPFDVEEQTFVRVWNRLRDGATLSRDDEPDYESLPALLDGRYRASGVMGMLDTVFDEVESATGPVRIWIDG